MDAGLIARRYATVLHDFAADRNKLDTVYQDALVVRQALSEQKEAQAFLESPLHKNSEKKALVQAAFGGHVAPETLQFLDFLVEKERISYAGSILLVFEMLYKKERNICTATVTTAKALNEKQQQKLVEQIREKMVTAGRKVEAVDASFKVDPAIIGGIILAVDGMQLDSSLQSKLKTLKRALTE